MTLGTMVRGRDEPAVRPLGVTSNFSSLRVRSHLDADRLAGQRMTCMTMALRGLIRSRAKALAAHIRSVKVPRKASTQVPNGATITVTPVKAKKQGMLKTTSVRRPSNHQTTEDRNSNRCPRVSHLAVISFSVMNT